MNISLNWISDFVDLSGLTLGEIVSRLTLSTAEVEGTESLTRSLAGVVVGRIVTAEPLTAPDGKHLWFCSVDLGEVTKTTVCGAQNVVVGMVAPFAPAGVTLASGELLTDTTLLGKPSQGVLCSAAELGLSTFHDVVMTFPSDTPIGTPLASLIPATDTLIDIDNKSLTHRPDLWGHYGFAREFAAIFGRPLKPLPTHSVTPYANLAAYPLELIDRDNCPCYGCIVFEADITVPSPVAMQARLHALGQRTYNLGVDVTNYVALELGQPTHAFDAEKLSAIRVDSLGRAERFVTLDGVSRELLPEDLMIFGSVAGSMKPVAIAGIKGGQETEVTPQTRSVLLEAANFRAARIRRTATRLDLRTDASQRFEKSQPPINVRVATERILHLLTTAIPLQVTSSFTCEGNLGDAPRTITLAPGELARKAGIDIPPARVKAILTSLGFVPQFCDDGSLVVSVPPFRSVSDIALDVDLVEEVLRIYGYDNIEPVMPAMPLSPRPIERALSWEHKSRRLFTGAHRFVEVHNDCWFDDQWLQTLGFDPGETISLRNPSTPWESRLRTTLVPMLLSLVAKNRPIRDTFRLLEYGHVFFPQQTGTCDEQQRVAGISYQASGSLQEHYLEIKGTLGEMSQMLFGTSDAAKRFEFVESNETLTPWQRAHHWQKIISGANTIGGVGLFDTDAGHVVWFELDASIFSESLLPRSTFAEPPRFPGSWQDFSILWRASDGFATLKRILDSFTHPLLKRCEFLTVYQGKGLEDGMASYSFRFTLGADDHTLTGAEIESFHQAFLALLQQHQLSLRA